MLLKLRMCEKGNQQSEGSGNYVRKDVEGTEIFSLANGRPGACVGCSQILGKLSSGRDWAHPMNSRGLRQMGFNKGKNVHDHRQ